MRRLSRSRGDGQEDRPTTVRPRGSLLTRPPPGPPSLPTGTCCRARRPVLGGRREGGGSPSVGRAQRESSGGGRGRHQHSGVEAGAGHGRSAGALWGVSLWAEHAAPRGLPQPACPGEAPRPRCHLGLTPLRPSCAFVLLCRQRHRSRKACQGLPCRPPAPRGPHSGITDAWRPQLCFFQASKFHQP